MAERRIYSKFKSRSDTDGIGPINSWDDGIDTLRVTIPRGKKFTRYSFYNESFIGSASIENAPRKNATGVIEFKIKWNYLVTGKSQYRLYVYCDDLAAQESGILRIVYGSSNWDQQALNAISQDIPFKLIIRGLEAAVLGNAIRQFQGRSRSEIRRSISTRAQAVAPAVLITVAIIFGVIVVTGFVTLAFVLNKAIDEGKCPNSTFTNSGPNPIISELSIDVQNCT